MDGGVGLVLSYYVYAVLFIALCNICLLFYATIERSVLWLLCGGKKWIFIAPCFFLRYATVIIIARLFLLNLLFRVGLFVRAPCTCLRNIDFYSWQPLKSIHVFMLGDYLPYCLHALLKVQQNVKCIFFFKNKFKNTWSILSFTM